MDLLQPYHTVTVVFITQFPPLLITSELLLMTMTLKIGTIYTKNFQLLNIKSMVSADSN